MTVRQANEPKQVTITLSDHSWSEVKALAGNGNIESVLSALIIRGLGVGEWSNAAALGYAIMAATDLGMNRKQINDLTTAMYRRFDRNTQAEAEQAYYEW